MGGRDHPQRLGPRGKAGLLKQMEKEAVGETFELWSQVDNYERIVLGHTEEAIESWRETEDLNTKSCGQQSVMPNIVGAHWQNHI